MGLFSNIISAAVTVSGATGGWVDAQDGAHFNVTTTDDQGGRAQVQVSIVGSGNLAPADHYSSAEYASWYDQHYGIAPLD